MHAHSHTHTYNTSLYMCTHRHACAYSYTQTHTCAQLTHNSHHTHLYPCTHSHTHKRIQHSYKHTTHSYTCARTQNTVAHADMLIHPHIPHTYSLALSHGTPKSVSLPFNASTPASRYPNQPLSSHQEQWQPDHLLLGKLLCTHNTWKLRAEAIIEARSVSRRPPWGLLVANALSSSKNDQTLIVVSGW